MLSIKQIDKEISDRHSSKPELQFDAFPSDPAQRVKYAMALMSRHFASSPNINPDNLLILKCRNPIEIQYAWTAAMKKTH